MVSIYIPKLSYFFHCAVFNQEHHGKCHGLLKENWARKDCTAFHFVEKMLCNFNTFQRVSHWIEMSDFLTSLLKY